MNKMKPYWAVSVNNYLCDAAYNDQELKARHPIPSFRKFHFIRSNDELKYFAKRDEISNEELVEKWLNQKQP
jgi:hypothetical protein